MTSVQALRQFINERLNAAAVEIFTVFEQTIVRYEEKIESQHRMLDISLEPQTSLHRTDPPQHHGCREEQPFKQKTIYCLEQEEPEPPQIREEEAESGVLQFGEEQEEPDLLQIKEEPEDSGLIQFKEDWDEPQTPQIKEEQEEPGVIQFKEDWEYPKMTQIKEEPEETELSEFQEDQEEPEPLQINENRGLGVSQEGERFILRFESDTVRVTCTEEQNYQSEPEEGPDTEQLLSHDSVHHLKKYIDSESAVKANMKKTSIFPSDHVDSETLLLEETRDENVLKKPNLCQNLRTVTDKKKISCEICRKNYSRQDALLRHMRSHTGEKPYTCETCGKSFSVHSILLVHIRTHTGEKPYSCKSCGKTFNDHGNLLRHLRTHTGEKPYSCETCGKSFSVHSHLLVHMRIHTGEKPYSCETCGKGFVVHSHLMVHMRIHTGEKPYSCKTCGKSFSVHSNLLRHMKTHRCEASHYRENISPHAARMASVQALREFISERLNAAAVEIFTVFEQTIVRYEEKIESQHRLLQINWNPQIKLHRADTATRNMKKCRACHEKIHVAYKKCPKCKAAQPHKERLLKARKRFEEKEIEWKDKVKMNHNATHVLDSCFLMLDRIAALGHFPILLLGKKKKTTYTTDIITSLKMKLDDGLQASIKSMYARVLQLHFSRFPQPTAGNSREEGRTDHAFVFFEPPFESVLDLNPVPPNGPDVFEAVDEGTGNTEGLADHDTATRNMKKCRACHEKIHVACKKCPKCKAAQPHKERLLKARKRFEAKEIEWKDKVKMNCNATQVLDSCFIMLDRIAALGHFPVLVLAKKRKTKYIPYVFTSLKMKLDDGLQASIKSMYARVLQLHFSRFPQPTQPPQPTAGKSREEGRTDHGPTEERLVVLDLCPVPPNAPDVFDEGTGDAEGLADHEKQAEFHCEETCGEKLNFCQNVRIVTDEKKFSCEVCGKNFNQKAALLVHMRIHTGEKPFSCEMCGKSFNQKNAMLVHKRTHTGERPYTCKACGKGFRAQCYLSVHMRIHTGEKPYACEVCSRCFNQRTNLMNHMRTHTGEKPYSCETCGKRFTVQGNLLVHMRTHTREKPYMCETCGKWFSSRSHFSHHVRTHTGWKLHGCEICCKNFNQQSDLRNHMRIHTNEKL
ncbi:uncharacterized protein LOC115396400 [Salarias fasciatus]|nr:uncharacterized protein LOC115396400 [Salarias fasciatus]